MEKPIREREERGKEVWARRAFLKVLGLGSSGLVIDQISGGKLSAALKGSTLENNRSEIPPTVEVLTHEIHEKARQKLDPCSEQEGAQSRMIDYAGTALFAVGVRDLLPGGHGHLNQYHYAALVALLTIKHQFSNEQEKHHLEEEMIANAKALGIIAGTIVLAEGLQMDVERAYQEVAGKKPDPKDQVAIMTLLSSVLSPIATTVGSASIIKKMSNDLCQDDPEMMATCVSHVSNLSGYLLFGDPPFIAVCEKYGFQEGVRWQIQTMWPLALYSLLRSTYKLNMSLAQKQGSYGSAAREKARKESLTGLLSNLPILAQMIGKSLINLGKYFTGADLSKRFSQNPGGIEVAIGEVIAEKLKALAKLPFSDEFDRPAHEGHEGLVSDDDLRIKGGNDVALAFFRRLSEVKPEQETDSENSDTTPILFARLEKAVEKRDYDQVEALGKALGVENMAYFCEILRDLHDNSRIDDSTKQLPKTVLEHLNPIRLYDKITDVNRLKNALGHNLGDVLDVFPFQAGSVPFLTPVFKDLMDQVGRTGEFSKELIGFLLIMAFSMMADNYVACKIGLEIFPEKPELPLIASIQGGSMTAIGNMANVAQFSLDQYSMMGSFRQVGIHAGPTVVSLAWAKVLGALRNLGFTFAQPPAVK